jgi:hypothetical protein
MIKRVYIRNYKAIHNIDVKLTPVHAFIGPYDSGKTSILNALASFSRTTDYELQHAFIGSWEGRELVWHGDLEGIIRLSADLSIGGKEFSYSLASRFPNAGRRVVVQEEKISIEKEMDAGHHGAEETRVRAVCVSNRDAPEELKPVCLDVHEALSGVHSYRWNPRMLALPVAPDSTRRFRMNSASADVGP